MFCVFIFFIVVMDREGVVVRCFWVWVFGRIIDFRKVLVLFIYFVKGFKMGLFFLNLGVRKYFLEIFN